MFEVTEPFHVRFPLPLRHKAGAMELEGVAFDGAVVRATFRKAAESFGWWCARSVHEYEWLPDVRSPADAARHYADWLAAEHDQPLADTQREALRSGAEVAPAGRGQAVYLSADLAGLRIPGGKNWLYVVSAGGERGALRIPDSAYQSYPVDRFEVAGSAPDAEPGAAPDPAA